MAILCCGAIEEIWPDNLGRYLPFLATRRLVLASSVAYNHHGALFGGRTKRRSNYLGGTSVCGGHGERKQSLVALEMAAVGFAESAKRMVV